MTLESAVDALGAQSVIPALDRDVELAGCFAADLMSDVLAFAAEGCLLVTGLATDHVIRTAAIKRLVAVVVIGGKEPNADMVEAAREEAVPLYRTPLSKYEACGLLMQSGLGPYSANVRGSAQPTGG